ncbi:MAG: hypothetical protein FWB85_03410 [Chitinispirillia bacterium]|nr:hypothetical protein [Chitinispirillia bacterium]MCL2241473.1 hypothetical protein [Chitinispirillia bacterium]
MSKCLKYRFLGVTVAAIILSSWAAADAQQQNIVWYTSNQEADTFQISTAAQLAGLARLVNDDKIGFKGKTIVLANDINLTGYGVGTQFNKGLGWIPIGYSEGFAGNFDGNGKTIRGFSYTNVPMVFPQ